MAPVRSHIKITNKHVLSIRTFLNYSEINKNKVEPLKSIPDPDKKKLKPRRMIISNRHLSELFNDKNIKSKLITVLFELNKEEFFSITEFPVRKAETNSTTRNFKDNELLYVSVNTDNWKCKLSISWDDIEVLRNWLGGLEVPSNRSNWRKCEKIMLKNKDTDTKFDKTYLSPVDVNIHIFSKI